ncbi:MAG: exonuclease SbcCD subunit D [Candidatus Acetothermia bacterium]
MKFLVTADLHLQEGAPERIKAFRWLVEQGSNEDVDGMLIGGDLFDDKDAFQTLNEKLLPWLEEGGIEFPVLTVPGNHDSHLTNSAHTGKNFRVLGENDNPAKISGDEEDARITGLPYRKGRSRKALTERNPDNPEEDTTILLTHGSLVDPERSRIFEEIELQEEENDHLIFRRDFADLDYDCVIIGHWHQASHLEAEETKFLYPGSPLPTSRKENGRKWYWLLRTSGGEKVQFEKREVTSEGSWYHRKKSLFSVPGYGDDLPEELREILSNAKGDERCSLTVEINGFVPKKDYVELKGKLEKVRREFETTFHSVQLNWNAAADEQLVEPFSRRFIEGIELLDRSEVDLNEILQEDESRYADLFREIVDGEFPEIKKRALKKSLKVISDRLN